MPISQTFIVGLVQALIDTGEGSHLKLVLNCVVVCPDIPKDHLVSLFEDANEEDAFKCPCKLHSHSEAVGKYLNFAFSSVTCCHVWTGNGG